MPRRFDGSQHCDRRLKTNDRIWRHGFDARKWIRALAPIAAGDGSLHRQRVTTLASASLADRSVANSGSQEPPGRSRRTNAGQFADDGTDTRRPGGRRVDEVSSEWTRPGIRSGTHSSCARGVGRRRAPQGFHGSLGSLGSERWCISGR